MGADFRDIDNDGLPDLFVTALANETFPLYRNLAKGLFQDLTYRSRIGPATLPHSGWGTGSSISITTAGRIFSSQMAT